jgi:hypothetical protein
MFVVVVVVVVVVVGQIYVDRTELRPPSESMSRTRVLLGAGHGPEEELRRVCL